MARLLRELFSEDTWTSIVTELEEKGEATDKLLVLSGEEVVDISDVLGEMKDGVWEVKEYGDKIKRLFSSNKENTVRLSLLELCRNHSINNERAFIELGKAYVNYDEATGTVTNGDEVVEKVKEILPELFVAKPVEVKEEAKEDKKPQSVNPPNNTEESVSLSDELYEDMFGTK